jgi:hypothetical protein
MQERKRWAVEGVSEKTIQIIKYVSVTHGVKLGEALDYIVCEFITDEKRDRDSIENYFPGFMMHKS